MMGEVATIAMTPPIASLTAVMAATSTRLGGGGTLDVSLTRIVSALLLCLVLAGIGILVLKRGGGQVTPSVLRNWRRVAVDRRVEVIESRRISAHADVCLLRCDDHDYLVLAGPSELRLLRRSQARNFRP